MSAKRNQSPSLGDDRADAPAQSDTGPESSPLPAPSDIAIFPLSRFTLATCAAATILISLFIIGAICFRLLEGVGHPIVEALMLVIIVLWVSIPRANSDRDLLFKAAYHSIILFPILYFLAYQTPIAFWLIFFVLVAIVFDEHSHRLQHEPFHTKIAQTLTIFFL